MATTLQLRRGTAAEAAALTGAQGELFIDVDNKLVYLHDGVTAGGIQVGGTGGGAAVVSGAVSGNTLTLTNSDATTVNVNVATLAQDANTFVSSATVNGSVITLHNNDGSTVNIQLPSSVTGFLPGEVMEDMVPGFDSVYDLGTSAERWYDAYLGNKLDINGAAVSGTSVLVPGETIITPTTTTENLSTTSIPSGATASNGYIMPWNAGAENEAKLLAIPVGTVVTIQGTTSNYFMGGGTGTIVANNGLVGPGPNGWYAVQLQWDQTVELISISSISWTQDTVTNVQTQLPDTYDYTLASNATLVAPSVAADTSLVGGLFTEGSTITPEGTPLEYSDIKGTLTIDGNLVVADDLSVRNKIALKQVPVTIGTVTEFGIIPSTSVGASLDNISASNIGLRSISFTSDGNTNTMYFNSASQAEAFLANMAVGSTISPTVVDGMNGGTYNGVAQITDVWYANGNTQIDFRCTFISGTAPWNIASWTTWSFPWWTPGSYQIASLGYTTVSPAQHVVAFDGNVPDLSTVYKLYINGVSTVNGTQSYSSLANFGAAQIGPNEPMYLNNFQFVNVEATEYLIVNSMGGNTAYYNFFQTCPSITLTDVSGLSWTIHPGTVVSTPWGNALVFTVTSASNPSYPTPRSYSTYFTGNQMGISYTSAVDLKGLLVNANTSISGVNKYASSTDISQYFTVGDTATYKTPVTSLVFGDETSGVSKAISYNETTGTISYDGLVTAVNYDEAKSALYSSKARDLSQLGVRSISIGDYAKGAAQDSIAIGYYSESQQSSIAIGDWAKAKGAYNVSIGHGESGGMYSTYVGNGGADMGNMYHTTVLGMVGTGSSGWMWSGGSHVVTLGLANAYVNQAGDWATVINGNGGQLNNTNLIGGSTWFAPMDRHAEIKLSAYQYKYSSGATTIYPQFGYYAGSGVPMDIPTTGSTNLSSALDAQMQTGLIIQGKIIVTVQRRNSDDYGIYEIAFVTRDSNANTVSIVQQTTTVIAQSGAATYWNNPVVYLQSNRYLQLSLTTTASSANNYITVHVGGDIRMNNAY